MTERIALAHVYNNREVFDGAIHPSKRGLIQVCALWYLARENKLSGVFLAGGELWGGKYRSLAVVMARELRNVGVNTPLYIVDEAVDTSQEIDLYLHEAKNQNWKNLVFVANETHLKRIKDLVNNRGVKRAEFIAAEQVLESLPYFQRFIGNFRSSEIEESFQEREKKVRLAYRLGLEKLLTFIAKISRKRRFTTSFDE